ISLSGGQNGDSEFAEIANHATTSAIGSHACHRNEATGWTFAVFMSVVFSAHGAPPDHASLNPADPDVDEIAEHPSRHHVGECDGSIAPDLRAPDLLADTCSTCEDLGADGHK